MSINSPKKQMFILLKKLFDNHITSTEIDLFSSEKNKIIDNFINEIKLSDKDYLILKKELLAQLENVMILQAKELDNIVKCLKNKFEKCDMQYISKDEDPAIYFNISNNDSYLINYDSIDKCWYLSKIEAETLNFIEEIHSNYYDEFINFLEKFH